MEGMCGGDCESLCGNWYAKLFCTHLPSSTAVKFGVLARKVKSIEKFPYVL